jgi:redox-sensitive bicupin YhaK (pirin superfamily)
MKDANLSGSRISIRRLACKVSAVETPEGAGAIVKRVFPTRHLSHFDPFVLLDEFSIRHPAGFPDHPDHEQTVTTRRKYKV